MTKLEAWISKFLFSEDSSEKGLRNPQKVYDLLNIQPRGKIILISGTNGKGTTGEILTQLGLQKGLKVGTFSSPHLIRINERIKINGEPISDNLFLNSLESVKEAKGDIPLNFFQYLALAMMKIFNDENIDLWIVEIGIGGRLDPTNILNADLSIITNVQLDHEEILGKGIENIAKEKAGIIKENKTVIIGETHPETKEVFIQSARDKKSDIIFADQNINKSYPSDLNGYYQQKNQKTALEALYFLKSKNHKIPEVALK